MSRINEASKTLLRMFGTAFISALLVGVGITLVLNSMQDEGALITSDNSFLTWMLIITFAAAGVTVLLYSKLMQEKIVWNV